MKGAADPVRLGWRALRRHVADARRHVEAARALRPVGDGDAAGDPRAVRAVHEARKALKRARACARLLAPALGEEVAHSVDRHARDAGRHLAALRDVAAVRAALEVVRGRIETYAGLDEGAWDALARALGPAEGPLAAGPEVGAPPAGAAPGRAAAGHAAPGRAAAAPEAAAALDAAAAELAALRGLLRGSARPQPSAAAWAKGLRALHRAARRAARAALAAPGDDELVHTARSRWKRLGLAVRGYRTAAPALMRPWLAEVEAVGALLGDDHDQVMLRERLAAGMPGWPEEHLVGIRAASLEVGADLRAEALARLARLAAEPSKGFAARHRAYVAQSRASPSLAVRT